MARRADRDRAVGAVRYGSPLREIPSDTNLWHRLETVAVGWGLEGLRHPHGRSFASALPVN